MMILFLILTNNYVSFSLSPLRVNSKHAHLQTFALLPTVCCVVVLCTRDSLTPPSSNARFFGPVRGPVTNYTIKYMHLFAFHATLPSSHMSYTPLLLARSLSTPLLVVLQRGSSTHLSTCWLARSFDRSLVLWPALLPPKPPAPSQSVTGLTCSADGRRRWWRCWWSWSGPSQQQQPAEQQPQQCPEQRQQQPEPEQQPQ